MELLQTIVFSFVGTAKSLLPFTPLLALCFLAEKIWAKYDVKNRDAIINVIYTLTALAVSHGIILPWFYQLNKYFPHNLPRIETDALTDIQSICYWMIYLIAFDFLYYWFHRAQHTFAWMWRYHMVHHVDENISCTAFAKHHWLEEIWRYTFMTVPIFLLFDSPQSAPYFTTIVIVTLAVFMHWNTPLYFGPLEKIIITPHYHRIHHSIEMPHYNKNFGAIFQVWDWLFGTRHTPEKNEFPRTGLKGIPGGNFYTLLLPIPLFRENNPPSSEHCDGVDSGNAQIR